MKNRICTICARGGSKGCKNKNIRDLRNKPLLAYSIEQARASGCFVAIALDSDSPEILEIGKKFGVDFCIKRPDELASDSAPKLPAIQHCVQEVENTIGKTFDIIVDLDVTSPLRSVNDIVEVVHLLEESGCSNVITGCVARRSPYFNLVEMDENGVVQLAKKLEKPIFRRQDSPRCFDMNASIYAWKREALGKGNSVFLHDTRLWVMPEERSWDIDSLLDFQFVEFLMSHRET